jgi:hypothetical protein
MLPDLPNINVNYLKNENIEFGLKTQPSGRPVLHTHNLSLSLSLSKYQI